MASLVESGVKNLHFGDADSVGFFQMRVGIWNKGDYAGFPEKPELQVKWFLDQAEAVKKQRIAAGKSVTDPNQFGDWIADVERPAEQYRGRYGLRLGEANGLLGQAGLGARRAAAVAAAAAAPASRARRSAAAAAAPPEPKPGESGQFMAAAADARRTRRRAARARSWPSSRPPARRARCAVRGVGAGHGRRRRRGGARLRLEHARRVRAAASRRPSSASTRPASTPAPRSTSTSRRPASAPATRGARAS